MKKKLLAFNLAKLFFALVIGGILGVKLLAKGIGNGEIIPIILFFAICAVLGFVLAKIDIRKEP